MNIIVEKRSSDYKAYVDGLPSLWGAGKSIDEAIGSVIRVHGEAFDVRIAQISDDLTVNLIRRHAARACVTVQQFMDAINDDELVDKLRADMKARKAVTR